MKQAKPSPTIRLFGCDFLTTVSSWREDRTPHWQRSRCYNIAPRDLAFSQLVLFSARDVPDPPWRETAFSSSLCIFLHYCITNMANTRILPRFFVHLRESFQAPRSRVLNTRHLRKGCSPAIDVTCSGRSFLFQNVPGLSTTTNPLACFFVFLFSCLIFLPTSYDLTPTYFSHLFYCLSPFIPPPPHLKGRDLYQFYSKLHPIEPCLGA